MSNFEYQASSVKDTLAEMKDVSELMLDLSYSAALYNNIEIAREVSDLEKKADELIYHIRISVILSARKLEDAERMASVLQIAEAAEKISNAAGDIAKIVIEGISLPENFKGYLSEAEETIGEGKVGTGGVAEGKKLGEIKMETETGMKAIAIKREDSWIYNPTKDTELKNGDTVIARGPREGLPKFCKMCSGEEKKTEYDIGEEGNGMAAETAIEMKNISELATGLAYSAILFYSEEIANEVMQLEELMDRMNNKLEMDVLKSARNYSDEELEKLSGLLRIGRISEVISDAAMEIADIVLRGVEPHPIFAFAVRESDEIISRKEIKDGSKLEGKTLGEVTLRTKTGMNVMAVRRGKNWIYNPSGKTRLESGDILIAKGREEGEKRLNELAGGDGQKE